MEDQQKPADPLAWFDDLVRDHPGAESYRPKVEEMRTIVREAFASADAEVQRARNFMQDKLKRYLIELVTSAFDKQATYTTAILSIGYVGLFAAWSQTAAAISPALNRVVIVSALSSLAVFILFEVLKMIYGQAMVFRTLRVVKAEGEAFDPDLHEYLKANESSRRWFYVAWFAAVALTLALGIASAGVLVYAHLERLFFPALP